MAKYYIITGGFPCSLDVDPNIPESLFEELSMDLLCLGICIYNDKYKYINPMSEEGRRITYSLRKIETDP